MLPNLHLEATCQGTISPLRSNQTKAHTGRMGAVRGWKLELNFVPENSDVREG
ncbi:MAG: hypothetical protein IT258_17030 [Saprospiraceae bacterium]|nr:hypothetical protein [Saprospiraceae bacterium]